MHQQLSLLELSMRAAEKSSQPPQPQLDIDFGIWRTRYGKTPWGWEGYGQYEHLYDAKYPTEESAIAAAVEAINTHNQRAK